MPAAWHYVASSHLPIYFLERAGDAHVLAMVCVQETKPRAMLFPGQVDHAQFHLLPIHMRAEYASLHMALARGCTAAAAARDSR